MRQTLAVQGIYQGPSSWPDNYTAEELQKVHRPIGRPLTVLYRHLR